MQRKHCDEEAPEGIDGGYHRGSREDRRLLVTFRHAMALRAAVLGLSGCASVANQLAREAMASSFWSCSSRCRWISRHSWSTASASLRV
jgi:uncharacterized protein YceK